MSNRLLQRRRHIAVYENYYYQNAYASRVLATNPIAYWKLNEGGGSTIRDSSGNGYDGTYSGVTWDGTQGVKGGPVPFWDGANDYGDVYSAGFAGAFDLDEFTILLWLRMANAGVWTDGTVRRLLRFFRDADNQLQLYKPSDNTIQFLREGAATTKTINAAGLTTTDWLSFIGSCSVAGGGLLAAGESAFWVNGTEVGTRTTGNLATTGSGLVSTATVLGAFDTAPILVHHGYLAHAAIWNTPATQAIINLGAA